MAETKKPTNRERLQEITAGIEQGIKELFESGRYAAYLRTMSRFHRYSVNNQMLIHMQKPDATLVAGFNKWRSQFERHVKKGEKGIQIIAPTPFKKRVEEQKLDPDTKLPVLDRNGKVVMEEKEVEIPMFRPVSVFDVSQTEGKPLPQLAADLHGDVKQYEVFMEALRRSSPVPMEIRPIQEDMDGYFSFDEQRIAIREGMSEVQTVSAAVHEIAHAKLHNYKQERQEAAKGDDTKNPPAEKDEEEYEEIELFGKPGLFSNGRVSHNELPDGLFCYDLRGSDDDYGDPVTVEERVAVNHAGSVILAAPLELPEEGFLRLTEENGLDFTGEDMTLSQFLQAQKKDRSTEEVEAESVSYAVCQYYGIQTGENSFGYIAGWSKGKELPELRASLETITKTASGLITDIDKHFRDICKERGIDLTAPAQAAPERAAPVEDTPERFAADLYDYMTGLHDAGLIDQPFTLDPRDKAVPDIADEYHRGLFSDTRDWLENASKLTGAPSAADLLERLSKLEQARDAALIFKMHANPRSTGKADTFFVQAYEKADLGLIPREVVYIGPTDECRGLLHRMEDGSAKLGDLRDLDRVRAGQPPRQDGFLVGGKATGPMTEQDALLLMANLDKRLFGMVTMETLEAAEKAGCRFTDGALSPLPEPEAVYALDDAMYLHIQESGDGFDYTLYAKDTLQMLDGGQFDAPGLSLDDACEEIFVLHDLTPEVIERLPAAVMDVIDPPPKLPGAEPPQGPPYDVTAYTDRQWKEITAGWKSGVDTAKYANPAFDAMQMNRIRVGLEKDLPASLYNKPNLSWEQMDIVMKLMGQGHDVMELNVGGRPVDFTDPALSLSDMKGLLRQMEYDAIPKMLYTPEQWAEIRRGMEAGLDVKQYADPKLAPEDMAKQRDALERGLVTLSGGQANDPTQPGYEQWSEPASPENAPEHPGVPSDDVSAYLPELTLDEYPMPDPALTVDDLEKCGYRDGDMLPLSKDRALELFEQDLTIYTVAEDGEAAMAFDREDIEAHGGLLAVPREEWEDAPDFSAAVEDRLKHQEQREAAFLQSPKDTFAVYQPKEGGELQGLRERSLSELEAHGRKVERENYDLVYTSRFPKYSGLRDRLEGIFSNGLPADCQRPDLATGDIIVIKQSGVVSCHYCDSLDFVELPGFFPADNPLKNADMAVEDDYGMIDGIINNGPKQPTVAELEAKVKEGQQISLTDLASAVQRERQKQSVVERLKQQPPQRDKKKEAPKRSAEREL